MQIWWFSPGTSGPWDFQGLIVQLSNRNQYFYPFRCHHPLITQLTYPYIPGWFPNSITQLILVIIPLLVDADDSEAPGGLKADEDNWQLFVFVQDDVIEVPAVAHGGGGGAVAVVPVPKAIKTGIILLMYQVTADFGTS